MLDIKWICENPDTVRTALKNRRTEAPLDKILELNDRRKKLQREFDEKRAEQNQKSKEIPLLKKAGEDAGALLAAMQDLAARVKELGHEQTKVEDELRHHALYLPNIPDPSVPIGSDESGNIEIRRVGLPATFAFKPKEHWEIGEALGLMDFERAARIAGARFAVLRGSLARLERALGQLMLDTHVQNHGYEEMLPPFLTNAQTMTGTGQLPKFEADLFKTTDGYYLIPTAEVPVTNFYQGEILDEALLPKSFCAFTPCFRSEAGSHGKDVKGLIRQHQFNKVELVKLTRPEDSEAQHEKLTRDAERILEILELPYRTVVLCTGDMGANAAKTYDIEVWLPGQNAYREISSCSNFRDFQARRMNTRFRRGKNVEFVHTLNGSGLAVGRTLVAILENYQTADGKVRVPEALKPYMGTDLIG